VAEEKRFTSYDGFGVVWLQLGPRQPALASARSSPPASAPPRR